jgi:cystathionine beta-synthase
MEKKKIYENILEVIGNSPMVRLNKIPESEGIQCEIVAKCEFLLPGGSCKDRIAKRMIEDAEKNGSLVSGGTIIEPTSGNTGIGLAMVGAVKGYEVIITLPEKMSQEKADTLNSLGARVIRTLGDGGYDDPGSSIGLARKLKSEIPNSVLLDQYSNPGNSLVHYDETAEEIWQQCDGKVDYIVVGVGTGGTITGVGRKLKELNPNCKVIGVDPYGSILSDPDEGAINKSAIKAYQIEGIGYDFIPKNVDKKVIDQWVKTDDRESFRMARRIIKEEGLMVGGSSGSTLVAALKIAKELPKEKRVVIMFIDGVRNYISKFLNDDWMLEHEYITQEEYDELQKTSDNSLPYGQEFKVEEVDLPILEKVSSSLSVEQIFGEFEKQKCNALPVFDSKDEGKIIGIVTKRAVTNALSKGKVDFQSTLEKITDFNECRRLSSDDSVAHLSKSFIKNKYALINYGGMKFGICEQMHLVKFFLSKQHK